jgi:hypothetical protein
MGGFCSAVNEDMKSEAKRELQEVLARKSEGRWQLNVLCFKFRETQFLFSSA